MTSPPNSRPTGSHTLLVRKPSPYFSMAGHAPTNSEARIPARIANVKIAAARAPHAKSKSGTTIEAARRGAVGARPTRSARPREATPDIVIAMLQIGRAHV